MSIGRESDPRGVISPKFKVSAETQGRLDQINNMSLLDRMMFVFQALFTFSDKHGQKGSDVAPVDFLEIIGLERNEAENMLQSSQELGEEAADSLLSNSKFTSALDTLNSLDHSSSSMLDTLKNLGPDHKESLLVAARLYVEQLAKFDSRMADPEFMTGIEKTIDNLTGGQITSNKELEIVPSSNLG